MTAVGRSLIGLCHSNTEIKELTDTLIKIRAYSKYAFRIYDPDPGRAYRIKVINKNGPKQPHKRPITDALKMCEMKHGTESKSFFKKSIKESKNLSLNKNLAITHQY